MAVELALPDGGEEWGEGHGVNGGGMVFADAPPLESVASVAERVEGAAASPFLLLADSPG